MIKNLARPSCSPPPLSAFTDSARTRPTAQEMERRRKELKIVVTTGLGSDVDRYVSQSPTLIKQLMKIKSKKWKIVWGPAGKGSQTQRPDKRTKQEAIITIDSQFKTNNSQNIAYVTSTIAHEVGHAYLFKDINLSSFKEFMESLLLGGGREYDFMKNEFVQFFNEGIRVGNIKIAEIYSEQYTSTSNPPQKYRDSYGDYCKNYTKN